MSDRRLQIQRALENLKSNERAAEFESLAAHLARQRHPTLVVTERKADGGEDLTSFVADEQRRRIRGAVSLTGTLEKIRKDARRQRKLGVQSDLLVFVTTEAISNLEVGEWCRKFREEFGYDLAVLGQAELIAELEKPENEWLCVDYLGIDPLVEALGSYLDEVIERSDKLLLAGIDPKSSDPNTCKRLDLANVYIGLSTGLRRPLREDEKLKRAADPQRNLATESVSVSALEAAAEHSRLVLTGLPGSGKTTFIRHLCLCLAQHLRTRDAAWLDRLRSSGWEGRPLVPIVVELRAFARSLPQDLKVPPESGALWKFFVEQVLDDGLRIHSDRLLKLLESGRALVIFEGLDEVPTGPQRQYVRAAIEVFAAARRFRASQVLVTCRSRAYAGEQLKLVDRTREDAPRFAEAPLEDFDRTRIQRFTESWYRELARLDASLADSAVDRAEQLFSALQAPALWPHAGRPMLLTVMANVHARNDRLPHERAQVYAEMVQILVESWDNVRLRDQAPLRRLLEEARKTHKDLIVFLSGLAYAAHARDRARDAGSEALADIPKHGPEGLLETLAAWSGSRDRADALIEAVEQRAGLLVSPDPGAAVFQFPHRSFQEYLAGVHLADQDDFEERALQLINEGTIGSTEAGEDSGYWDETVKWAVGWIAHVAEGKRRWKEIPIIAERLCQTTGGSPALVRHRQILAAEILTEMGEYKASDPRTNGGPDCRARVQQRLHQQKGDWEAVSPRERCEAGRVLGGLGDPRPSVVPRTLQQLREMEFCWVAPSPFWMGMNEDDAHELEELFGVSQEQAVRLDALPNGFWIARHAITVAQFGQFAADKGYETRAWWVEAELAGVWTDGRIKGFTWDDDTEQVVEEERTRPGDSGLHFNTPNHPVVGITWYEAIAYCRWMNHHYLTNDLLRLRLPSEAEWELAARGGEWIPNSNQTGILAGRLMHVQSQELVPNPQPRRVFPWGDAAETNFANTHELGFSGTSVAGCFGCGSSPYGIEELSGNVWEWTRSLWGRDRGASQFKYPYRVGDGREDKNASRGVMRVLRGGSFDDPGALARCAFRFRGAPDFRDWNIGFRLVASPVDSVS